MCVGDDIILDHETQEVRGDRELQRTLQIHRFGAVLYTGDARSERDSIIQK